MARHSVRRRTDNPIEGIEDDRLQRASIAKSFVGQVLDLDATRGLAVGVFGPWGSGKTSFVNLARLELERTDIPTLDFNPWMFNGEEQLVVRFFGEVSASLGQQKNLRNVAQAIAKYGGAIAGVCGRSKYRVHRAWCASSDAAWGGAQVGRTASAGWWLRRCGGTRRCRRSPPATGSTRTS